MVLIADDNVTITEWLNFLLQFANQPFQLRGIPPNATDAERVRVVVEWICEEGLLPTFVSPEIPEGCCPCCGRSLMALEIEMVEAVQGYLHLSQPIETLLTVLNTQESLVAFIRDVQAHYDSLISAQH